MERPARPHLLAAALLMLGLMSAACKVGAESLGANCLTPQQACAGKRCGDSCSACSTESGVTPNVVGQCGVDGVCSAAVPTCAPVSTGGQAGSAGQGGSGGGGSAGCGKSGQPTGQLTGQTITVAGQTRTYALSVSPDYKGDTPLALVLAFHGANVTGALARDKIFNLESKSNGAAIFAYPDGLTTGGWEQASRNADLQFFTALVDALSSSYCIDPNRIFSTGHSTGAVLTNDLGCYYGDRLRAIAPVEGTPPNLAGRTGCTGKVAAMIVHGRNDPLFPLAQGQATRDFFLQQNGCAKQTATWAPEPACSEYQECQPDLPVLWCPHDEDHAWPNLTSDCQGGVCFDAGSAIWAFFSTFQ